MEESTQIPASEPQEALKGSDRQAESLSAKVRPIYREGQLADLELVWYSNPAKLLFGRKPKEIEEFAKSLQKMFWPLSARWLEAVETVIRTHGTIELSDYIQRTRRPINAVLEPCEDDQVYIRVYAADSLQDLTRRDTMDSGERKPDKLLFTTVAITADGKLQFDSMAQRVLLLEEPYPEELSGLSQHLEPLSGATLSLIVSRGPFPLDANFALVENDRAILECHIERLEALGLTLITFASAYQGLHSQLESLIERTGLMLDALNDGFWDVNLKTHRVYHNRRWFSMLGYEPEDFPEGYDPFPELLHPDESHEVQTYLSETLLAGKRYYREFRLRMKSGEYLWIAGRGMCVQWDADGKPVRFVGTQTDISERRRAQSALQEHLDDLDDLVRVRTEELAEALQESQRANEAKSEFLANMSHELRTPLNGVMGLCELLTQDTVLDGTQRRYVKGIEEASSSLLRLLEEILDLARIEEGTLSIERRDFDLHALLHSVADIFRVSAAEKGLSLRLEIDELVPRWVNTDDKRVRQILSNLVSNAVKFTTEGSVVLSVTPSADRQELLFTVADTGIGISEEDRMRIFEKFYQSDSSLTREYGGAGLGLAICSRLLGLLGGDLIDVESVQGRGSTFSFSLAIDPVQNREPSVNEEPQAIVQFPQATILLAEDNELSRFVASRMLERFGCRIITASNGLEAIRLQERGAPDLILMDCQMPEIDGFRACRIIRENEEVGKHVPIIALTAHAFAEDRERCLSSGMDDYLTKPVKIRELSEVLSRYLSGPRAER